MKISARVGDRVHQVTVERRDGLYAVEVDGVGYRVDSRKLDGDFYSCLMAGRSYEVSVEMDGDRYFVRRGAAEQMVVLTDPGRQAREGHSPGGEGPQEVVSVMPGKVVRVLVSRGDTVEQGQGLVVVEAMKMENEIASPKPGRITEVEVEPGQTVEVGATLVVVE